MRRVFRIPFSRTRIEREVDDELAFHLETRVARLMAQGMAEADARREALRQFGDVTAVRSDILVLDRQREASSNRSAGWSDLRQDLSYAVRGLRRNLSFTLLVVGGLALGIGSNAAIYSVIDAVLLRGLPVAHPEQLVAIGDPNDVDSFGEGTPRADLFSYPLYRDIRDYNRVFSGLVATGRAERLDVRVDASAEDGEPEHPRGRFVTGNYFAVLGVRAIAGRTLDSTSDLVAGATEVTISDGYWTRRFHNDPSAIGRSILVDGVRATITGVAAAGFSGEIVGASTDMWLPAGAHDLLLPSRAALRDRRMAWLQLLGRVKPGISLAQARQQLIPIISSSIYANATSDDLRSLKDRPLEYFIASGARGFSSVRETFAAPLVTLMVGVGLLLCVVCVNVANLLLARGAARRREMSLRLAIGANRARIVRQLLTESIVLALVSGVAALLVGWWGSVALVTLASEGESISLAIAPNVNVLAFTFLLSITSVVVFGLAPALRTSRVDLAAAIRTESRSFSASARSGVLLIIGQVALSLVLLAGASVLTRSLRRVEATDLGLDRDHLIVADLDVGRTNYAVERVAAFAHAVRDRVASVPGVAAVTYSGNGLFAGTDWSMDVQVPGFSPSSAEDARASNDHVGPDYARGIGARLIAGRDLTTSDESARFRVATVNQSFERSYFPGRSAVGQFVRVAGGRVPVEIVGVISDSRGQSVNPPVGRRARRMYYPFVRNADPTNLPEHLHLIVRTTGEPAAAMQAVRAAIASVDNTVVLDEITPLTSMVRASIREERLVARIATALGVLALVLAAIGLYGVTSYSVARRTSEIGVRVALGAQATDVAGMVLRGTLRPVIVGVVLGTPAAIVAMRLLQTHLTNVMPVDLGSIAAATGVLLASAMLAAVAPARRAVSIDPVTALRE